jgi:hypothetical protein
VCLHWYFTTTNGKKKLTCVWAAYAQMPPNLAWPRKDTSAGRDRSSNLSASSQRTRTKGDRLCFPFPGPRYVQTRRADKAKDAAHARFELSLSSPSSSLFQRPLAVRLGAKKKKETR